MKRIDVARTSRSRVPRLIGIRLIVNFSPPARQKRCLSFFAPFLLKRVTLALFQNQLLVQLCSLVPKFNADTRHAHAVVACASQA